jgi:hypothetical protein
MPEIYVSNINEIDFAGPLALLYCGIECRKTTEVTEHRLLTTYFVH